MISYPALPIEELASELAEQQERYDAYKHLGLKLNMARGKPSPEQLDLSLPMLNAVPADGSQDMLHAGAADDLRNYGTPEGLPEMRAVLGAVMGVPAANVLAGGNSSLTWMHNLVSLAMTHGVLGSTPWAKLDEPPVFLCPVPGYDRHFAITEHFGITMVPVPLKEDGPDMDVVEQQVQSNAQVKGIWCVPRFSNPTGCVYSDEIVERFAALAPAAEDFRIYWDNAYVVHGLAADDASTKLRNIKEACEAAAHPNLWYQFTSTSKITFAGGGVAAFASSEENLASIKAAMGVQSIGPDKINQLRHVQFLPNLEAVNAHMTQQAALLEPKFAMVLRVLSEELGSAGIGAWTQPRGGYFITYTGAPNTARRIVGLAAKAGVVLTPAGAPFPYGNDPLDNVIRIAPSYPSVDELETATRIFAVCARIAELENRMEK